MRFKTGNSGGGRPKGSTNKTTKEIRLLFTELLENNLPSVQEKLNQIGDENPIKYIELLLKLSEYAIPKLTGVQQVQVLEPQTYKVSFDFEEN